MADDHGGPPEATGPRPRRPGKVGRAMQQARYVAAVPAVGMVLVSLGTVLWAAVKAVSVAGGIIADPSDLDVIADLRWRSACSRSRAGADGAGRWRGSPSDPAIRPDRT